VTTESTSLSTLPFAGLGPTVVSGARYSLPLMSSCRGKTVRPDSPEWLARPLRPLFSLVYGMLFPGLLASARASQSLFIAHSSSPPQP
jgi:hypothetical protein